MKKWLFNPFTFVAGFKSLVLGFIFMFATGIIAYYSNTHFDGILHMNSIGFYSIWLNISEQFLGWACAVLIFYITGLILSRSHIRFIDVAGTMALSRWPFIIVAFLGFMDTTPVRSIKDIHSTIIIKALVDLPFMVWVVVLMYNAFSVSCNVKKQKAIIGFIIALLAAHFLSYVVTHQVYNHFR
ncbi:MAG TPA: YIP1 family protein [Flavipsychrobacter sp.]|nr:YIP1 family protein [Flavipsychrobacter sp.]